MNAIKTLLVGLVLLTAAYGVYMAVTSGPPTEPPSENAKTAEHEIVIEEDPDEAPNEGVTTIAAEGIDPLADADPEKPAPRFNRGSSKSANSTAASNGRKSADPFAQAPTKRSAKLDVDDRDTIADEADRDGDADRFLNDEGERDDADPIDVEADSAETLDSDRANVPAAYVDANSSPRERGEFSSSIAKIERLLDRNQLAEAQLELSQWYESTALSDEEFERMMDLLDQVTGTVLYSKESHLEPAYTVERGDTLADVAAEYEISAELLANINGLEHGQKLRAGDKLKVLRGPFDATIDLQDGLLTLWLGERYAGRFEIRVGRDGPKSAGGFVVQEKVPNPPYEGSKPLDADDRNNPLGELALRLSKQVWIHGSRSAKSYLDEDRGWIRLSPRDVQDVYDILTVGSKATIRK